MQTQFDNDHRALPKGIGLHALIFVTALCTLLLEILLTRVLSLVMWYHLTFAVVSISLLGIAAGAIHFHRKVADSDASTLSTIGFWSTAGLGLNFFSIAVALPVILMSILVATPTLSFQGIVLLLIYFTVCAAPFYASGYVTAAIFHIGAKKISALYAVDLIGASLGCLLAIPFLDRLGGIGSLAIVGWIAAVASTVLAFRFASGIRKGLALVTVLMFTALMVRQVSDSKVDLRTVKLSAREEFRPVLEVKWNSHSRLAVLDYYNPKEDSHFPFLSWGLSDVYDGWLPRQYLITIDGASETPITEVKEDIKDHAYLAWDVTSLPYHLRNGAKTLVIGSGGGRDLMTALWFDSNDVTGVELNRGIVDWMQGKYADFSGHIYNRPEVTIHVDDGRSFIRGSSQHYDVLQISMIDTFAAAAAGAYTLSENNLYTSEAFDQYLSHLTDDGILSINRFFLTPPQQTLRIVTLAREALMRRGVEDPSKHVVVVRKDHPLGNNGLVMIKKTPFTTEETSIVRSVCSSRQFEPIFLPDEHLDNVFTSYLEAPDPNQFYDEYAFDVRPPTDDWPFFFNTCKVATLFDALRIRGAMNAFRVYNFDAVFILFVLLALSVVSLMLFIFLPLRRSARKHQGSHDRMPASKLSYFVCLGAGFILLEIVLIQRYHLYLGHPVYSLAVILVSVLAFSGIGSAFTTRLSNGKLSRHLVVVCAAVIGSIVLHEVFWTTFLESTLGSPLSTRLFLAVISLLPIGICMGMPYPLGLRAVSEANPAGLPWVWAINAAASVVGSIAAFAIAMAAGSRVVLFLSGCCYACAIFTSSALRLPRQTGQSRGRLEDSIDARQETTKQTAARQEEPVLAGSADSL